MIDKQESPEPQNVTRRRFIKRSGGATVGTAIGLYALRTPAWAQGEDDSSVVWAMLCTLPDPESQPIIEQKQNFWVYPPLGGTGVLVTLQIEADTTKYADPPGTDPYWTCEFSHSFRASINVVATTVFSVRNFWANCDPANGHISYSQIGPGSPSPNWSPTTFQLNGWTATLGVEMYNTQIDEVDVDPPRRVLTVSTAGRALLHLEKAGVPTSPLNHMSPWATQPNRFESQRL